MADNTATLIYACNGVSAFGRLTTSTAYELEDRGVGKVGCLAGLGAGIPSKVEAARSAGRVVALDGCGLCCVKTLMEKAHVSRCQNFVAAECKIKASGRKTAPEEARKFADYVEKHLE